MAQPFIAEVKIWANTFAPWGWSTCEGQILPISQYSALFALIGSTYGGDWRTTMGLPNLKGSTAMNWGNAPGLSPYAFGEFSGFPFVTLYESHNPSHSHTVRAVRKLAGTTTPDSTKYWGVGFEPGATTHKCYEAYDASNTVDMASTMVSPIGGQPHENRQPFLAINYCIALQGLFPSRN